MFTHCPAVDPLGGVITGMASQVQDVPFTIANSYIGPDASSSMLPSGIAIQPAMTDIVFNATNTTGRLLAGLITREGTEVLNCDHVHTVLEGFKAAYCCDILPPLFWYISCWYLMAWAMCCCGLPAGEASCINGTQGVCSTASAAFMTTRNG